MCLRSLLLPLALASVLGCSHPESEVSVVDFNTVPLVPAGGVITLQGKPLAHAVVSFMPKHGPIASGETDENGRYALIYGREGAPVGDYVVAVSYLVSAEGEPQGVDIRSRLVLPPSMGKAQERLPREYSDLGQSKLHAKVPAKGSTALNFELKGPLLPGPEPTLREPPPPPPS